MSSRSGWPTARGAWSRTQQWRRMLLAGLAVAAVGVGAQIPSAGALETPPEPTPEASSSPVDADGRRIDEEPLPVDDEAPSSDEGQHPSGGVDEATFEDAPLSPASVPAPAADEVVITVKVGGDRLPDAVDPVTQFVDVRATGVEGVTLRLSSSSTSSTSWQLYPWATCVSDADGDCNFVIPLRSTTGAQGMAANARPYMHQVSAEDGWSIAYAPFNASALALVQSNVFRVDFALVAGETYASTTTTTTPGARPSIPFMKRLDDSKANSPTDTTLEARISSSSGRSMVVRDNPLMTEQCGIDVAVVMDVSASIGSALPSAKQAVDALVNGLAGTPSSVALFNFETTSPSAAHPDHPALMPVRTQAEAATVKSLYSSWTTSGATNWDQALYRVATAPDDFDVAVVLTDGVPTVHSTVPFVYDGGWPSLRDLEASVFSANLVKAGGTRVVPFYVSPNTADARTQNSLRLVSGPTRGDDFHYATSYTQAAQQLAAFAAGNCETAVKIEKRVVNPGVDTTGMTKTQLDAVSAPAADWVFDASANSPASIAGGSTSFTTAADGTAVVPLAFADPATTGTFALNERQRDDYDLVQVGGQNAVCTQAGTTTVVPVTNTTAPTSPAPGFSASASAAYGLDCVMYNQRDQAETATVTIIKQVRDVAGENTDPASGWEMNAVVAPTAGGVTTAPTATSQLTAADGSTPPWILSFDSAGARAEVTVSETQQAGYEFVSGTCAVAAPGTPVLDVAVLAATGTTIPGIAPGTQVECTFVNRELPGTVTWEKVDASTTVEHLGGSEWTLQGPGAGGDTITVADCTEVPCAGGADTDARPGHLNVTGLAWGEYTLTETRAPAGYVLDTTPRTVTISADALLVALGQIENAQQGVPSIPLTGGLGADHYLMAGGALLLLTTGLVLWQHRRRRTQLN